MTSSRVLVLTYLIHHRFCLLCRFLMYVMWLFFLGLYFTYGDCTGHTSSHSYLGHYYYITLRLRFCKTVSSFVRVFLAFLSVVEWYIRLSWVSWVALQIIGWSHSLESLWKNFFNFPGLGKFLKTEYMAYGLSFWNVLQEVLESHCSSLLLQCLQWMLNSPVLYTWGSFYLLGDGLLIYFYLLPGNGFIWSRKHSQT